MQRILKIGLGGGCHWCTEAVFQSLKGVEKVHQGFIASLGENTSFSEGIIVEYNPEKISLKVLISIHLHTHKSTSLHAMRDKYRSAIYTMTVENRTTVPLILKELQADFEKKLITKALPYRDFKLSDTRFQNYYASDTDRPFCKTHIQPKLRLLLERFSGQVKAQAEEN